MLIVACLGLAFNLVMMKVLHGSHGHHHHDHDHDHGHSHSHGDNNNNEEG